MNFFLTDIPEREKKPRESGLTMVMDRGMSVDQAKSMIQICGNYIDIIKLGFGTSAISQNIEKKIKYYHDAGLKVYLGGTLFEAFVVREMYSEYKTLMEKWNIKMCEVSDGSITIDHSKKCRYIEDLSKNFVVVSEIGSKDANVNMSTETWTNLMKRELESGSWKVIAEAREEGNIGIFNAQGEVKSDLINQILEKISGDKILWEAPKKSQQVWFIKLLGPNVNLGNISSDEIISLETLRIGLRGDTFSDYLSTKTQ